MQQNNIINLSTHGMLWWTWQFVVKAVKHNSSDFVWNILRYVTLNFSD